MDDPHTDNATLIQALIDEQRITNDRLDRLAKAVSKLATENTLKAIIEEVAAVNRETNVRLDYILKSWSKRPEKPTGALS